MTWGEWNLVEGDGREPALVHLRTGYWIPLREVLTEGDAAKWLLHLGRKSWFTEYDRQTLREALGEWLAKEAA